MTTNIQLEDLARRNGIVNFKCIMNDEIKQERSMLQECNWILNLDDANTEGSHWVALLVRDGEKCYCDSFGCVPSLQVTAFLHKTPGKYMFNNKIIQDLRSTQCGLFSLGAIIYANRHKDMSLHECVDNYCDQFSHDTKKNDAIIKAFFKNLGGGGRNEKMGGDLVSAIKFSMGNYGFTSSAQAMLDKYGDKSIESITICRTPVQEVFSKLLSTISKKFDKGYKNMPYDKLYHLFLEIRCGKTKLIVEKNENIQITLAKQRENTDKFPITSGFQGKTLNELFKNDEKVIGTKALHYYQADSTNCQHFVFNLLRNSQIGGSEIEEFIMQNTDALFDKSLKSFANKTTSLGAFFGHLTN